MQPNLALILPLSLAIDNGLHSYGQPCSFFYFIVLQRIKKYKRYIYNMFNTFVHLLHFLLISKLYTNLGKF